MENEDLLIIRLPNTVMANILLARIRLEGLYERQQETRDSPRTCR